jgi:uncharacterized protein (DUF1501 family)
METLLSVMPLADVYHVSLGNFDTHSNQRDRHAKMWTDVSAAVATFWEQLEPRGLAERTAILMYSEFGRRVEENASGGTDHGAAGPAFVVGNVRGGLFGDYPSLSNLDSGDLRHGVDFRQVYASLLEGWMQTPSRDILGGKFDGLPLWG